MSKRPLSESSFSGLLEPPAKVFKKNPIEVKLAEITTSLLALTNCMTSMQDQLTRIENQVIVITQSSIQQPTIHPSSLTRFKPNPALWKQLKDD